MLNFNDLVFLVSLLALLPFLVNRYLGGGFFSSKFKKLALLSGFLCLLMGFYLNDWFFEILKVSRADDEWHDFNARQLANSISYQGLDALAEYFQFGNPAYHVCLALFYFITGVTKRSGEMLNGFFGFWGSLAVCSHIARSASKTQTPFVAPNYLLWIVFLPSTLFWSTNLYKEGPMYWAICMVFSSWQQTQEDPGLKMTIGPGFVLGALVGVLFRPYMMVLWITSISMVIFLQSSGVFRRILMVGVCLAGIGAALSQLGTNMDFGELKQAGDTLARQTQSIQSEEGEGGGSNIQYESGRGTFLISGFVSLFFRPFPWDVRNFRFLLSSVEIWVLSCSIIIGWLQAGPEMRTALIRRPDIKAAIIACFLFSCVFSFVVNQGILARSRLQAMPAIIILAFSPFLLRKSLRQQMYCESMVAYPEYRIDR